MSLSVLIVNLHFYRKTEKLLMNKKNVDLSRELMNDQPKQLFIPYRTIISVKSRQPRQSELYLTVAANLHLLI